MRREVFRAEDLELVDRAPPPDVPPLEVGDMCMLNSGGPPMLVVALFWDVVAVSWDGGMEKFPADCVRRCLG